MVLIEGRCDICKTRGNVVRMEVILPEITLEDNRGREITGYDISTYVDICLRCAKEVVKEFD